MQKQRVIDKLLGSSIYSRTEFTTKCTLKHFICVWDEEGSGRQGREEKCEFTLTPVQCPKLKAQPLKVWKVLRYLTMPGGNLKWTTTTPSFRLNKNNQEVTRKDCPSSQCKQNAIWIPGGEKKTNRICARPRLWSMTNTDFYGPQLLLLYSPNKSNCMYSNTVIMVSYSILYWWPSVV